MRLTGKCSAAFKEEPSSDLLLECYQESIECGELIPDPHQKIIIQELQEVYNHLLTSYSINTASNTLSSSRSYFANLFSIVEDKPTLAHLHSSKGLYIWGGIGRGKTHLVNYFYQLLPIEKKLRLHFHRFMQLIHDELNSLDSVADPLQVVARRMVNRASLLVLDEVHISDITDAMLLGRLFEHLFNLGVILVATSNTRPDELYKNGLQREHFLPAICLLEQHTKVVKLEGDVDYRLQTIEQTGLYQLASGVLSDQRMQHYFHQLSGVELHQDRTDILINHRSIPVKMWADDVVWFSFEMLCNTPRSAEDYIQIATFFHTILISDIPLMDSTMDDVARRFVNMIDVFYDRHATLLVSAEAKPEKLYIGNQLTFEFQRATSRLIEMQSKDYLRVSL